MSLQLFGVQDRGPAVLVDISESDSNAAVSNIKPFKMATLPLIAGVQNSFNFNWQNPETVAIMVLGLIVHVTVAGVATSVIDAGTAAATATHSDNLLDGQALDAAPAWLNSYTNRANNGRCTQYMDANGGATDWICGQTLTAAGTNLAGYVYIIYVPLA